MKKYVIFILLVFTGFLGVVNSANSAGDALLYISSIKGESLVQGHEGWIDLLTWSWELSNDSTDIPNTGSGAGKPIVGPIKVTKYIDKSSPFLTLFVLTGGHIRDATLVLRKTGQKDFDYLQIRMWDVQVSNVSPGGMSNDYRFTESVSFDFSRVCYSYTPQKLDGSADAQITKCFDIIRNQPFSR
jgi:type VI secretion system secreted protein Hcp